MKEQKINWIVVLIIFAVAYIFVPSVQTFVNGIFEGDVNGEEQPVCGNTICEMGESSANCATDCGEGGSCPIEDTTISLNSHDKFKKNTDITDGDHRVFLNGADKGWVADAGTVTATPGDSITIYFGLNSTTYYPVVETGMVSCSGTMDLDAAMTKIDNTTSWLFKNQDGSTMSTSVGQDMSASTRYDLSLTIKATAKSSIGNPDLDGKNAVCFQYNTTAYSNVKIDGTSIIGIPFGLPASRTGYSWTCNGIPAIENDPDVPGDETFEGTLIVETKSTFTSVSTGAGLNISAILWDYSVDLHADTLAEIIGREDEDGNDIGDQNSAITGNYTTPIFIY